MRINPNVRVHTFKKAMAFASTTSKAEQVMKVVVACPQNMPTIYNVFSQFQCNGFCIATTQKRRKLSLWSKTNKPSERYEGQTTTL